MRRQTYLLSESVIVPSKSVKKMNFGFVFIAGSVLLEVDIFAENALVSLLKFDEIYEHKNIGRIVLK